MWVGSARRGPRGRWCRRSGSRAGARRRRGPGRAPRPRGRPRRCGRRAGRSCSRRGSRGRSSSSALRRTNRVWGSGPSDASTRSNTPSTMVSARSTSPPKSAWPGVSTMLSFTSVPPGGVHRTAVFLARMVMPFSRSRSRESMTRSTTSAFSRTPPVWRMKASTSVVLPWSTWAMIARLRMPSTGRRSGRTRASVMELAVGVISRPGGSWGSTSLADDRRVPQALGWVDL